MKEPYRGFVDTLKERMEPFMVHWPCKNQGWNAQDCSGELFCSGVVVKDQDAYYVHTCTKCGHTENLKNEKYPRIEYFPSGSVLENWKG